MIDITKAQANQQSVNGVDKDWVVTLDGEVLYTLPAYIKPEDTFIIRDAIEKVVNIAAAEVKEQEQQLCMVKINRVVENGNEQLNFLKDENERLATALEKHILNDEVA